jgi:glucose-6-phosphate isomerase
MNSRELWERYRRLLFDDRSIGLRVDTSRMGFADDFFAKRAASIERAFDAMKALEAGAIANPDEQRRVGHYWLRAAELAPTSEIRSAIEKTNEAIAKFASDVHSGAVKPERGGRFQHVLVIGIGGSALGPQFVSDALSSPRDPMRPHFVDNTDPDGIDRTIAGIGADLGRTLAITVSKSGGTKETRNGMLEVQAAFRTAGLSFAKHAVAVTGEDSELDRTAASEGWIARFPMWDWVGGRTSETSAVGLLPAALQGFDVDAFLRGARDADRVTRTRDAKRNPAMLLALSWFHAGDGAGKKDMVILPYKDRLALFSRYLQQLVMESLGKERNLRGEVVHQGIAVYGNKGSTDQHAYVQQLREGIANFFVTFIEVLRDRDGASIDVEPDVTSGDYLSGFLQGTRRALYENGRESITVTLDEVNARSVGVLIALYERAVGFYGSLVEVNAYHQPGVEAGKKAAGAVIAVQRKILAELRARRGQPRSPEDLAKAIGAPDEVETVARVLEHLAANVDHGVRRVAGQSPVDGTYAIA